MWDVSFVSQKVFDTLKHLYALSLTIDNCTNFWPRCEWRIDFIDAEASKQVTILMHFVIVEGHTTWNISCCLKTFFVFHSVSKTSIKRVTFLWSMSEQGFNVAFQKNST